MRSVGIDHTKGVSDRAIDRLRAAVVRSADTRGSRVSFDNRSLASSSSSRALLWGRAVEALSENKRMTPTPAAYVAAADSNGTPPLERLPPLALQRSSTLPNLAQAVSPLGSSHDVALGSSPNMASVGSSSVTPSSFKRLCASPPSDSSCSSSPCATDTPGLQTYLSRRRSSRSLLSQATNNASLLSASPWAAANRLAASSATPLARAGDAVGADEVASAAEPSATLDKLPQASAPSVTWSASASTSPVSTATEEVPREFRSAPAARLHMLHNVNCASGSITRPFRLPRL